jgi:hypothetical protein
MVIGEVVPLGPIVYAFGDETNHHSTTHHSTKMVHRLHRFTLIFFNSPKALKIVRRTQFYL